MALACRGAAARAILVAHWETLWCCAGKALFGEPCDAGQPVGADASTLVDELSSAAWGHLRLRLANASIPKLKTALGHLGRFERAVRANRPNLFVVPKEAGGQAALLHNE